MLRRLTLSLIVLICLAIGIPSIPVLNNIVGPIISVEQAQAQQKKKRKTLFELLFKRKKKKKTKRVKSKVKIKKKKKVRTLRKTTRKKNKTAKTNNRTTVRKNTVVRNKKKARKKVPIVAVTKNEDANKILLVGDFLAGGMARGLENLYRSNPNIVIVNKSKPSSGIVRDDVIDWGKTIPTLIAEVKPAAVITMIGMNDRQKFWQLPGQPSKLTAEWLTEYNKRVTNIISASATKSVPMLWVGLPPVRQSSMTADFLAFNDIYQTKIETSASTEYVDIWDGFTNEEGKFVSAGPDINGQIVRLRGKKGINMTKAGSAKIAFFADKALRKFGIITNTDGAEFAKLGTINLNSAQPNAPEYDPVGSGRTNVISLGSPALDGGELLEGGKEETNKANQKNSVSYNLVEKGEILLPRVGRVDSSWGKQKEIEIIKPEEDKDKKKTSSLIPVNNQTLSTSDIPLTTTN